MMKSSIRLDEHKLKDGDEVLYYKIVDNSSILYLFTNKGNLYKTKINDFEVAKPSSLGDYLPALCRMEEGELITAVVALDPTRKESTKNLVFIFENGKGVRIPLKEFEIQTKRQRLTQAINIKSLPVAVLCEEKEKEILLVSEQSKAIVIKQELIGKASHAGAAGTGLLSMKNGVKLIAAMVLEEEEEIALPSKIRKDAVPSPGVPIDWPIE